MAFQAVPDTAEIVVNYSGNGSTMANVFHAKKSGGYILADIVALADAVDAVIVADWLVRQADCFSYVSTVVRGLDEENDLEATNTDGAGPGAVATVGQPTNVTFSVKKTSGLTGRSARGRAYWIGMPAADLAADENTLDAGAVTAIVAAIDEIRIEIATAGWIPSIVSRFTNNAKRITGVTFEWTDSSAVNNVVDSQRRRLP